ncbi:glycosyltransferase [Bacillus pseudomycoides]|uniref:glycosyltransferase n=1 Tax=Bacillus pseudomycoides TaxID=64104 RepID=UPI000BEB2C5C|nr:glycosyltransferase [Bacillus pseudomycoides]PDY47472.1 glycosyltransferase [Bacillus pseudomycoides]
MTKKETIPFRDFMDGSYKNKKKKSDIEVIGKVISAVAPALILILPKSILAAGLNGSFGNIHEAVMRGFDAGIVLVIVFSGACWALGHRSRSIELLIGASCGYILARHAVDIRDFLKGI